MADVSAECQDNVLAIVRRCLALGITHFETARGYGCSELQYGAALRTVIESGAAALTCLTLPALHPLPACLPYPALPCPVIPYHTLL